ncbi:hypothetical protein F4810DRAFT_101194 [Camillea tinctor]|nr:hypothetical protein F4810DRAFT_101194 [Camillea tinctor]
MAMNRLHPLDSLFRAANRLGLNIGSNSSTTTTATGEAAKTSTSAATAASSSGTCVPAPDRVVNKPFTSEVRAGIERWISDTRRALSTKASPSITTTSDYSAACYAPLAGEVGNVNDEDAVSSPLLQTPLSCSTMSRLVESESESESESEENRRKIDMELDEEQLTRGRSRTRKEYGYISIVPPVPELVREDAYVELVSPVSSGSRSSSRVSALSARCEKEQLWQGAEALSEDEDDEDREDGGCQIRVIPPSAGNSEWDAGSDADGEDGQGGEIQIGIVLQ